MNETILNLHLTDSINNSYTPQYYGNYWLSLILTFQKVNYISETFILVYIYSAHVVECPMGGKLFIHNFFFNIPFVEIYTVK